MKTKAFLLTLALVGSCFAEDPKGQPNPLIAKIDARLAELKTECDQDAATINRLTDFRRIQLQKNSQAYRQCLEASLRIKEGKSEEKLLQTYRTSLAGVSPSANRESPAARLARESAEARALMTPAGKAGLDKKQLQAVEEAELAEYKRKVIAEANAMNNSSRKVEKSAKSLEAEVMAIAAQDVVYNKTIHGPKIKDIFIGMTVHQFNKIATVLSQSTETKISKPRLTVSQDNGKYKLAYYGIDDTKELFDFPSIVGEIDSKGFLTSINVAYSTAKRIFKANDLEEDEFIEKFETAYGVKFTARIEEKINALGSGKYIATTYRALTKEGVIIEIENFKLSINKTASDKDVDDAFN